MFLPLPTVESTRRHARVGGGACDQPVCIAKHGALDDGAPPGVPVN